MSNHNDSKDLLTHAKLDILDTYIFKGTTGTVLVMNTNTPRNPSYNGTGWDPEAVYDMKIDVSSDAVPDFALRATFSGHTHADGTPSAQRWSLTAHIGHGADNPESPGLCLIANAPTDQVHTAFGGIKAFAGTAGEPFFAPFPLVSKVATAIQTGAVIDWSDWDPSKAENGFGNTNINTIVVEIPSGFGLFNGQRIGYNATVTIPTDSGTCWRQIDRAAKSFISTAFGFTGDDKYHEGKPSHDDATFGPVIERLTKAVVAANNYHPDPTAYAKEVRARLFPDLMPYTVGTDADISKWNGRALAGDATAAMFRYFLHKNDIETGLTIADATGELRDEFPYLAAPIAV